MKTYKVRVRRVIREDILVEVAASSRANAIDLAVMDATSIPSDKWDCYDCDYLCDENDIEKED